MRTTVVARQIIEEEELRKFMKEWEKAKANQSEINSCFWV